MNCISNLRCADDVILLDISLGQLKKMTDFKRSTENTCIQELTALKTKVPTNQRSNKRTEIEIEKMKVQILTPQGKVEYLDQRSTLMCQDLVEIEHRIRCARLAFLQNTVKSPRAGRSQVRHRIEAFWICDLSVDDVWSWNLADHKRTWKADTHNAKKNTTSYHPDKEQIQKQKHDTWRRHSRRWKK